MPVEHADLPATSPAAIDDIIIFIDVRERALLAAMDRVHVSGAVYTVVSATLHVGDAIVCRQMQHDTAAAQAVVVHALNEAAVVASQGAGTAYATRGGLALVPVFAYERKTPSDFVASVQPARTDTVPTIPRWHEQKQRLQAFCRLTGCLPALIMEQYVLHASTGQALGAMNIDQAHSVLHAASRRDGMPAWHAADLADTAKLLAKDARLVRDRQLVPQGWVRLGTPGDREAMAAMGPVIRKAGQFTPTQWWQAALTLIPGVSPGMAAALTARWPSMQALQLDLAACQSARQRQALIADVPHDGRRIGPAIAARLVDRVFTDDLVPRHGPDETRERAVVLVPAKKRKQK